MTRVAKKLFRRTPSWFLCALSAGFCLVGLEMAVRVSGLDLRAVRGHVYTVEGDYRYDGAAEIYRDSDDVERLYELIPDTRATFALKHHADTDRAPSLISVDWLGLRSNGQGAGRQRKKPDGVFRIIAMGGSNTFGPLVSDFETWPARLERELERRAPGRFEVWNAGLNAYNLTQKSAYARTLARDCDPDLILFQHYNAGRRAFFYKADLARFFRANSDLWCENAPLICPGLNPASGWHMSAVRHCALYRLGVCLYNNRVIAAAGPRAFDRSLRGSCFEKYISSFPDALSARVFAAFVRDCARNGGPKAAVIVNWPQTAELVAAGGLPVLSWGELAAAEKKPEEYFAIHPPSQVYAWCAQRTAQWLIDEGLIPESAFKTRQNRYA